MAGLSELCNIDAEKNVLGAIIIKPDVIYEVSTLISSEDFSRQVHKIIFSTMLTMAREKKSIDLVSLPEQLRKDGNLERCSLTYVLSLSDVTPTAAGVMNHAEIIAKYAQRRKIAEIAENLHHEALDVQSDLNVVEAQNRLAKTMLPVGDELVTMHEAMFKMNEWMNERAKNEFNGILSGIAPLDVLSKGFDRNSLVVVAGRPSMGKTAFVVNIAADAASRQKKKVLFFSMEMLREDILARIIAIDSGINSERIRNPYTLNDEEWGRVFQAQNRIDNWQLIIDDKKRRTPDQILSLARQMQGRDGLDLIVIDYLQLMTDGLKHSGDNRVQEISNITTALKNIAGDLKIPVIVLSQLSRAVENRQDKRPVLSDLRDSGSIEQDADQVIFLYRDKYYHPEVPDDITEIDLKKCRNGKIGTVTARFVPELTKFVSVPQGQYVKNSSIPL